ncbi:MAG TPA: hypothetical protein VFF70_06255 [Anaerolineae bacterium]|nr:hypothetical protein [Anaerolineae bacterium]
MGWEKLILGGVETIRIKGTHDELLRSARQVAQVAQHLKAHLAALPPRRSWNTF